MTPHINQTPRQMQCTSKLFLSLFFPGHPQSDGTRDGPENEPASVKSSEHAQGGATDEQAQPSEHS